MPIARSASVDVVFSPERVDPAGNAAKAFGWSRLRRAALMGWLALSASLFAAHPIGAREQPAGPGLTIEEAEASQASEGNAAPEGLKSEPTEEAESNPADLNPSDGEELSSDPEDVSVDETVVAALETDEVPVSSGALASTHEFKNANSNFAFDYAIRAPAYRSISPRLALSYNSSRKAQVGGAYQGWLGVGWSLEGLMTMERGHPRGGAPRFDASDTYFLNGQEVIACGPAIVSPGCDAGGTHTTRIESYQRFEFDASANEWIVTLQNGNRLTLTPVGTHAGLTETSYTPGSNGYVDTTIEQQQAFHFRWVLSSIVDMHGNQVSVSWRCGSVPTCYVDQIDYGPTSIKFHFESRPDPITRATGGKISLIDERIKTIAITNAGSIARVYAIGYAQNPTSGISRVASVTEYGTDTTLDGTGAITAGSTLPATGFTYSDTATSFRNGPTLKSDNDRKTFAIGDLDGNGITDIYQKHSCPDHIGYFYYFEVDDSFYSRELPKECSTQASSGWFHGDFDGDGKIDRMRYRVDGSNVVSSKYYYQQEDGSFAEDATITPAPLPSSFPQHVLDQNRDLRDELIGEAAEDGLLADFDGDGWVERVDDYLDTRPSGRSSDYVLSSCLGRCMTGDFNGDGLADILSAKTPGANWSQSVKLWLYLSRGDGSFEKVEELLNFPASSGERMSTRSPTTMAMAETTSRWSILARRPVPAPWRKAIPPTS